MAEKQYPKDFPRRYLYAMQTMLGEKEKIGTNQKHHIEIEGPAMQDWYTQYNEIDRELFNSLKKNSTETVQIFLQELNQCIQDNNIPAQPFQATFNSSGKLEGITGGQRVGVASSIQMSSASASVSSSKDIRDLLKQAMKNEQKGFDGLQNVFKLNADRGRGDIPKTDHKIIDKGRLENLLEDIGSLEAIKKLLTDRSEPNTRIGMRIVNSIFENRAQNGLSGGAINELNNVLRSVPEQSRQYLNNDAKAQLESLPAQRGSRN